MRIPARVVSWLVGRLLTPGRVRYAHAQCSSEFVGAHRPDFIVGGSDDPYLLRWFLCRWSHWGHRWRRESESLLTWWKRFCMRWPVAYLHCFLRSDDDRALHDHPWWNVSIVLFGSYIEHTIDAGGIHRRTLRQAGDVVFRRAKQAHRVELLQVDGNPQPCWSLFITGFRLREWYFHCPERGLVHWKEFTAANDRGAIGRGCDA